ncbi:MAG: retropepsin-like aspartic protease [Pseudomonadota bacterium]|nr:retropepsin-like aspartic protease [Pseudomonadota bacterium]
MRKLISILALVLGSSAVAASETKQHIPLQDIGTNTYYISGNIVGSGKTRLLLDTGSGYSIISRGTLARLRANGRARYVKDLEGILADGSRKVVPVYRIPGITLGDRCHIADVDAAVLPAGSREILGLNALRKVMPMEISLEPPTLALSNCGSVTANAHRSGSPDLAAFPSRGD